MRSCDMTQFQLYARQADLKKLFEAKRLCFLIGGSAAQDPAALARSRTDCGDDFLPVVVTPWRPEASGPTKRSGRPAADAICRIYCSTAGAQNGRGTSSTPNGDWIELACPPTAFSHLVVYGG